MTPAEAIQFAQALDEHSKGYCTKAELTALRELHRMAPQALLAKVTRKLLDNAEAFRRSSAPGHETWYPYHLSAAAWAAGNFLPTEKSDPPPSR